MTTLQGEFGVGGGGPTGGPPNGPDGGGPGGEPGGAGDHSVEDPNFISVTVAHDDRSWPHVGMRYKGNSSLRDLWKMGVAKLPLRLDFDEFEDEYPSTEDQRFWGFKKLTFSPGFHDPSYLRETLAVEIMRGHDVPAAQATFYEVYVTVEGDEERYWGLYTCLEDPSDAMLASAFGDNDGNLYKPEMGCADWTCFDEEQFEKKTNEDEADFSDVEAAIEALHASNADPEAWRQGLDEVFDVDTFLRWLATNTVIENWDSYGKANHNYYLYGDLNDGGRLAWIPWDHNESMQHDRQSTLSLELDEVTDEWPLIRYLMDDPVYAEIYYDALAETLVGPFAEDEFANRALELWDIIEPYVEAEEAPYTTLDSYGEFEDSVTGPSGLIRHAQERQDLVIVTLASLD
ncbi:MAG: CotH kinase family protein [Proteobacteria bacterium]|nr:CotH kinase family protein [Pseudomonadota bacterium]